MHHSVDSSVELLVADLVAHGNQAEKYNTERPPSAGAKAAPTPEHPLLVPSDTVDQRTVNVPGAKLVPGWQRISSITP